jgi:ribosomal protein L29
MRRDLARIKTIRREKQQAAGGGQPAAGRQ